VTLLPRAGSDDGVLIIDIEDAELPDHRRGHTKRPKPVNDHVGAARNHPASSRAALGSRRTVNTSSPACALRRQQPF
jgi:hypothetical protein